MEPTLFDMDSSEQKQQQQEEQQQEETAVKTTEGYTEEELNAPIFDEGPTRRTVEEWKKMHGSVYFTPFDDGVYIWRVLSRPEYRTLIDDKSLNTMDREEAMTNLCLLFPAMSMEEIKADSAGRASVLAEMIMAKSSFVAQSAPIKL